MRMDVTEKDLADRIEKISKKVEQEKAAKLSGAGQSGIVHGSRSDSFEQKLIQNFGKKSVNELLDVDCSLPKYSHVTPEYKSALISLKEAIEINRVIAQTVYGGAKDKSEDKPAYVKETLQTQFAKDHLIPMIKAFSTAAQVDWIPQAVSSSYIPEFELMKKVPGLFREIRMSTNPFNLPVKTSNTVAKIATEGAALQADSFTTGKIQFESTKFAEHFPISSEAGEDVLPDLIRIAREELVESQIRAMTEAMLNGDDSVTHMDNDIDGGASYLAQKSLKGLRKLAIDNSALVSVGSGMTVAKLDEMRTAMGKFGVNVNDLVYIVSPSVYHQMVNLSEVSSIDQVGNNATLLSGALAFFRGVAVCIAEQVREDVASTGVNTLAGPNDTAVAYLVNKRRFYTGMRRPLRIRVMMDLPDQDRWLLSSLTRWDFKGHAQSASESSVILAHNITV